MHKIVRANERGVSELGWLSSRFSFSFAEYWNAERMGFGTLRVLNDDRISPNTGFPMHHHENMEIVTVMLRGTLTHTDNMGNTGVLSAGEVQVMTAGTGVNHSEWNHDNTHAAELFQMWIQPSKNGLPPSYAQKTFSEEVEENTLVRLASGKKHESALFIHQEALVSRMRMSASSEFIYTGEGERRGLFLMVIDGEGEVFGELLKKRDTIEIWNVKQVTIKAFKPFELLFIEVNLRTG